MKKIFLLLTVVGMTILQSCDGDTGPQGAQGPAGYSAESAVFEITDVNFLAPSFSIVFPFGYQTLNSDHVLVYRLSGVTTDGDDIWKLVPETFYFPNGTRDFGYNYNATNSDVQIYLEGNNLGTISDAFRLNQVFRVVIVPGQFANKMNTTSYKEITTALNITDADFAKTQAKH